jgi:hypothetical protein
MALHREDLSPEELARQRALDRSWETAQRSLANNEFRAYLEASLERVTVSDAVTISGEQFLAETEPSAE